MRRILVTVGNKGIGQAIVTKLLEDFPDTYLLLGSRDVARGQNAIKQIIDKLGGNTASRVELVYIDVTSDGSLINAVENLAGLNWGQP